MALGVWLLTTQICITDYTMYWPSKDCKPPKSEILTGSIEILKGAVCEKALNEISTELQFEDIGQMAKLFKKKTGFSPIEFRRSILKMQEQLPKGNPALKKGKSDIYRLN
jgi:AraC-like DNA-binding protein